MKNIKVKYRKASNKDISDILKLFKEIFKRKISKDYYNWKYLYNNKYYVYIALIENKIIGHVAYNINLLQFKNNKIFFASRHSSMVAKKYRNKNIYKNLINQSINFLRKENIQSLLIWPNENNLLPSMKILDYFPIFSAPLLELKINGIKKNIKNNINFINLNKNENKLIFNQYISSHNSFSLLKDKNYLIKRYLLIPNNDFLIHEIKLKGKKSTIIFKIKKNNIFIMDILSKPVLQDIHIKKFINLFNNYKCSIFILSNIYLPLYKILILNSFIPSNYKFNCGFAEIKKSKITRDIIKNLSFFDYALGDTDVF